MASTSGAFITRAYPTPDGGIRVPIELGMSLVFRKLLKWNEEDIAMEIGCGYGTDDLLCLIPSQKYKKYIIMDIDPAVIQFKRSKNSQEKVEYHVGDIESLSTFKEEWLGKITKYISTNAFHCLKTSPPQRPAFQNVFNLLAPGGEAVLLFPIWHPFWEVEAQILNMSKWAVHNESPSDNKWSWTVELDEYLKILIDMGFEVLSSEYNYLETVYKQILELRDNYVEYCRRFSPVPDDIREDLMNDRFIRLWEYPKKNKHRERILKFTALGLHLKKPSDASGSL